MSEEKTKEQTNIPAAGTELDLKPGHPEDKIPEDKRPKPGDLDL